MEHDNRVRQQQWEQEGQLRERLWILAEYAGRTAAIKTAINEAEILYRLCQESANIEDLEQARGRLLQSLHEADFWFVEELDTELKDLRDKFVEQVYLIAAEKDLKSREAETFAENAHQLALNILDSIDSLKRRANRVSPVPSDSKAR